MLKLKVPPVIITLLFGALVWLLDHLFPNEALYFAHQKWLISSLIILGAIIALTGVLEFRRKSTTVNPHKPQNTTGLVDSGIYSISRNPMYLGLALILCSWILHTGNIYSLLFLPLFIWYMNAFQIIPEEKAMLEKFGGEFQKYKNGVRRWI
ncbi:MAG: isoprenylcysteine carboxylmethyltransferase family protein [Balneolaceae bacterium]